MICFFYPRSHRTFQWLTTSLSFSSPVAYTRGSGSRYRHACMSRERYSKTATVKPLINDPLKWLENCSPWRGGRLREFTNVLVWTIKRNSLSWANWCPRDGHWERWSLLEVPLYRRNIISLLQSVLLDFDPEQLISPVPIYTAGESRDQAYVAQNSLNFSGRFQAFTLYLVNEEFLSKKLHKLTVSYLKDTLK